ncbi:MAG: hypothetical protein LIO92_10615 [Clostridiales bacterium]|nr:hypothetical protein [Clostridiales bacterium]
MKRYLICLFIFIAVSIVCIMTGFSLAHDQRMEKLSSAGREPSVPEGTESSLPDGYPAANQEQVAYETEETEESGIGGKSEEYYLVCRNGFLLVFQKDRETICLYTHIPASDFPEAEQEKLQSGIGFSSMLEVLHYLESYTS